MPKHKAPNWSALLREMRETGMTQAEIATAVGLTQASVSERLSKESTVAEYATGLRILAAHREARKRAKVAA